MSGEKIGYDGNGIIVLTRQDGQINAECYRKTSKNMLAHSFRRPIMDKQKTTCLELKICLKTLEGGIMREDLMG